MRQAMLALAAAASLAGCSGSDSGPSVPPPPGCDFAFYGTCYSGASYTQQSCALASGLWLPQGCSGADLVGICADVSGLSTYYYSPYYTPMSGSYGCSGTYTPILGPTVNVWCDVRTTYALCADLTGPEADVSQYAALCGYAGGVWHTVGACPTAGRTGTCSYSDVSVSEADRYYDPATAASDSAACVGNGNTWTPG